MYRFFKKYFVLRIFLATAFLVSPILVNAGAFEQLFAPKSALWATWQTHNEKSLKSIEHRVWEQFLNNNIQQDSQGINRVSYAAVSDIERNNLRGYIDAMQKINISDYRRKEQLAYWINLYNAVTVDIVLAHYPVASIRDIDISPGFFSDGPWGKTLINVENKNLSLNDIEHRILRPIWNDARIHFAVNCASVGCPNLYQSAFVAESINEQLDVATKLFIRHPRGVRITDEGVVVSSIFSWFQQDFGDTEAEVIKFIQRYANTEMHDALQSIRFFAGDEYDWSLNDISGAAH